MWFQILVCSLFAINVVLFADNVVLRGVLFAVNLVSKIPCLRFEAILFAVHYSYKSIDEIHENRVSCLSFSPDRKFLASGSEDNSIKLWNIENIDNIYCQHHIQAHDSHINAVYFHYLEDEDGQTLTLASASSDTLIKLWNTENGQPIKTLKGHQNSIREITGCTDQKVFASCSHDGTIILWDLEKGKVNRILSNKPYFGMNITHVQGLTDNDKQNLRDLGAVEDENNNNGNH